MELLESLLAIFSADHAITGELKPHHEDTSDRRFVIHHEDRGFGFQGLSARHPKMC